MNHIVLNDYCKILDWDTYPKYHILFPAQYHLSRLKSLTFYTSTTIHYLIDSIIKVLMNYMLTLH